MLFTNCKIITNNKNNPRYPNTGYNVEIKLEKPKEDIGIMRAHSIAATSLKFNFIFVLILSVRQYPDVTADINIAIIRTTLYIFAKISLLF